MELILGSFISTALLDQFAIKIVLLPYSENNNFMIFVVFINKNEFKRLLKLVAIYFIIKCRILDNESLNANKKFNGLAQTF